MCVCVCVCVSVDVMKPDHIFFQYSGLLFFPPSLSFNILTPHMLMFFGSFLLFVIVCHFISKLQRRRACHKQRRDFACGNMLVFKVSSAASLLHNTQSQLLHISAMYDMLFKITTQFKTSFKHTTYLYINQTAGGCVTGAAEMSYSQSSLRLAGRQRWYWSV